MAGMIAVINSVIVGAFFGLLVYALLKASPFLWAGVGVVAFLISVVLHQRYQWAPWVKFDKHLPVMFPNTEE